MSGEEAEELCDSLRKSIASGQLRPPPPPTRGYDPTYKKYPEQPRSRKCRGGCETRTKSKDGYCRSCQEKTR